MDRSLLGVSSREVPTDRMQWQAVSCMSKNTIRFHVSDVDGKKIKNKKGVGLASIEGGESWQQAMCRKKGKYEDFQGTQQWQHDADTSKKIDWLCLIRACRHPSALYSILGNAGAKE